VGLLESGALETLVVGSPLSVLEPQQHSVHGLSEWVARFAIVLESSSTESGDYMSHFGGAGAPNQASGFEIEVTHKARIA
jgi:hypothetical protein